MLRIPISSHENHNFSLEQSLTAFGGAPFAQGSLGPYHAFDLLDKSEFDRHMQPRPVSRGLRDGGVGYIALLLSTIVLHIAMGM